MSLTVARELAKHEEATQQLHLWEAILAVHDALVAGGLDGLPAVYVERANAALLRAGDKDAGDYTDTELRAITVTSGARVWSEIADNDPIFRNETVVDANGGFYVATQQHYKRADLIPGSQAARTLFRPIRAEPKDGTVLDFVWGELVPYGAMRRDPQDNKIYTPIHETGVTLYEPHYPHLVPSEYKSTEDDCSTEKGGGSTIPRWADLEDGHVFIVGDKFSDYGKNYEVLRQFNKASSYRPTALAGDFYQQITEE